MKYFYLSFNEWRKLPKEVKEQYTFLSTAKTHPGDFEGESFIPFVPTRDLFYDACRNFEESNFDERYKKQIYSLDKEDIKYELKEYGEIIIFLVWEAENKLSERDIFIPWLTSTDLKDIKTFSFSRYLENLQNKNDDLFEI